MKFRTSIMERSRRTKRVKLKDGSVKEYKLKGGFFYRIHYTEPFGRPRVVETGPFRLKGEAKDAAAIRKEEIQSQHGMGQDRRSMTFRELTEVCLNHGDMYAEGAVKSRVSIQSYINNLNAYFGNFLIKNITQESLWEYRSRRLVAFRPTKPDEPKQTISEATVNRELATMRAMLFFAIGKKWVPPYLNPFFKAKRLLTTKNETARDVTLSKDDVWRLLASCVGEFKIKYTRKLRTQAEAKEVTAKHKIDNLHLRAMIAMSVDAGLRRGEILKLRWDDLDLERKRVIIRPETSKTGMGRVMPLTDRVITDLLILQERSEGDRPFPFVDIKRSFATAKKLAGLTDVRFHDLRRTHISIRANAGGNALAIGKSVGHSQLQTTMKHYTVIDDAACEEIRLQMNAYNGDSVQIESNTVN